MQDADMINFKDFTFISMILAIGALLPLQSEEKTLPKNMQSIMQQDKYVHANWGVYVKDVETGKVLFNMNSNRMVLPASTTKLFSVAALLQAYGDDYRFKTPVYALGEIDKGIFTGNLILVAQGDLTMGGRQGKTDAIAFTKLDHIIANNIPGVILTPEDPLAGIQALAKQVHDKGIRQIDGDILIDDRLFETTQKREMTLSPMIINENLIDMVVNPGTVGEAARLSWRPQAPGYTVTNQIKTVSKGEAIDLHITADEAGRNIVVQGSLPADQKDVVRTFSIKDPNHFAKTAFIEALQKLGIAVNLDKNKTASLPPKETFQGMTPMAVWTSPPLAEYAKLILKVSHNLGADLVPLLLAARKGETTFNAGMRELGNFTVQQVKVPADAFVFIDGAGGDENRLTPQAEVQLLEYMHKLPAKQFKNYYQALPILGVDGSLADFGKTTAAVGKVHAKTGTGVAFNLALGKFFLTTQTLAGYIDGKNGHLLLFMVSVNNGSMPTINDVIPIFEDLSQITGVIYDEVK